MNKIFLSLFLLASLQAGAQHKIAASDVTSIKISASQITKTVATYADIANDATLLNCPEPSRSDIKAFCDCISIQELPADKDKAYFEYGYEARLASMACADYKNESQEAVAAKISKWWDKYKTKFICRSTAFNMDSGSILKFAVFQGFKPFLEIIVGTYGMDINFIDPADNRNVLDYVNDELKKATRNLGEAHPKVKILREYKQLLIDIGGKPSI